MPHALIHAGNAGSWPRGLCVFFYSIAVFFAIVRNSMEIPYSWLVRPRLLVCAWMPMEVYRWRGTLNWLPWSFSVLLALKMLTGFIQIRRRIPASSECWRPGIPKLRPPNSSVLYRVLRRSCR